MTAPTSRQAIETARAALVTFLAGDLREAYVETSGIALFLARDDAGPSPMRGATAAMAGEITAILAPHVATVVSISATGTEVAAGQPIAVLRVLDEERPLPAPAAGVVGEPVAQPGDLLDYGAPVVALHAAAG